MEIIASEFKAKCLHLMDEVAKSGEPLIITKHGKPIAQLVPVRIPPKNLFGSMRDEIAETGDIMSPIESGWDAMSDKNDGMI